MSAIKFCDNHENLSRLIDVMAPDESDAVAMMEAYFDESDSEDDLRLLAVSGYLFEKGKCLDLDLEWADILREGGDPGNPLP
jgi:hypothetical protein